MVSTLLSCVGGAQQCIRELDSQNACLDGPKADLRKLLVSRFPAVERHTGCSLSSLITDIPFKRCLAVQSDEHE